MIQWKEDYSTGIPFVDEQHKMLFQIAGKAYSLLKNKFAVDKYDGIVAILNELKNYTIYHFQSEEDYMKSIHYNKLLSHKVEHDDFIARIQDIDLSQIDREQDESILKILDFVVDWIDKHILGKDKLIPAG